MTVISQAKQRARRISKWTKRLAYRNAVGHRVLAPSKNTNILVDGETVSLGRAVRS